MSQLVLCDQFYIFQCPQCQDFIMVKDNELNCRIFRHGVYKDTFQPINPHAPQSLCQQLLVADQIYGCGRPFQIVDRQGQLYSQCCPYI